MVLDRDNATPGPWAADVGRHISRVVAPGGAVICGDIAVPEDAVFIAESRMGWPASNALKAAADAVAIDARLVHERADNRYRADLETLDRQTRDLRAERDRAANMAAKRAQDLAEMSVRLDAAEAELARLRPLVPALERWMRFRYMPELSAAWKAYLASSKG